MAAVAVSMWQLVRRGAGFVDRCLIVLFLLFRARPGFWKVWSALTLREELVVRVRTPSGCARLVFNPMEVSELSVVDELLPGDIYIAQRAADRLVDCGAFKGISTIYLQDQIKAQHVVAYEPHPDNFRLLAKRLFRHIPQARCLNVAVGVSSGEVRSEGGVEWGGEWLTAAIWSAWCDCATSKSSSGAGVCC